MQKNSTKLKKGSASTRKKAADKASTGNGKRSTTTSKSNRKRLKELSADELMLLAWQKIYENHHPVKIGRR
ncbi:MAG TPA: hypothetical protein VKB86_01700 [Pyrinomonadaceae bacterium]|nr:hypothetical protein [Pyrinomonadaceae bacterium]